jgi:hypothetical protein
LIEPIETKRFSNDFLNENFSFTVLFSVVVELFPSGTSVLGIVDDAAAALFFDFLLVDFVVELAFDSV